MRDIHLPLLTLVLALFHTAECHYSHNTVSEEQKTLTKLGGGGGTGATYTTKGAFIS